MGELNLRQFQHEKLGRMSHTLFLARGSARLCPFHGGCRLKAAVLCAVVFLVFVQRSAQAQSESDTSPRQETSELFFDTYISDDVFKFSGGETTSKIYYGGVEYDRHTLKSNGHLFVRIWDLPATLAHARVRYVMEFLPLMLVRQPTLTDVWGNALAPTRKTVPGISISPVGFRWMWFDGRAVRPLWVVKVGEAVFTQKAFGNNASYENFTINSVLGFQIRLSSRYDLRLAYGYQHVSNGYSNNSNPGLDTLGPAFGLVYHMKKIGRW
jgi:Lipid A 3-O-deacylase (PagL)